MRSRNVVLRKRDIERKIVYCVSCDIRNDAIRIHAMKFEYEDEIGGKISREHSLSDEFNNIRESEFAFFGFSSEEVAQTIAFDGLDKLFETY